MKKLLFALPLAIAACTAPEEAPKVAAFVAMVVWPKQRKIKSLFGNCDFSCTSF
ncbi:MAG: hypothetical protein ACPGCW_02665 [Schleiferiaceae bacterium]